MSTVLRRGFVRDILFLVTGPNFGLNLVMNLDQVILPVPRKAFAQLIVELYALSIYPSVHISCANAFERPAVIMGHFNQL